MVESKAAIAGHPIHPMLIGLPIGLLTGAVLADIAYLVVNHQHVWLDISYWTALAGVVTGAFAAIFGFIDYFAIARGAVAKIATAHMVLNLLMIIAYAASLVTFGSAEKSANMLVPFVLQFVGFAMMMVSGWLGGEMVYRHRLAVVDEPKAASPSRSKVTSLRR